MFFIHGESPVRYRQALETVRRTAGNLRGRGLLAGDRLLLQLGNSPEFVYLYFAALQLGAIPMLVNPAARRFELEYYCEKARPRLAVTTRALEGQFRAGGIPFMAPGAIITIDGPSPGGFLGEVAGTHPLEDYECSAPGQAAALIFTSASDGNAKGALLTHGGIRVAAETAHRMLVDEHDVFISMLPFFHSFGLTSSLILPLYSGVPFMLIERFSPRTLVGLLSKATIACGVPGMYEILAKALPAGTRYPGMKAWISGGEALSSGLQASLLEHHLIDLRQGYGLTEASPIVAWNDLDNPSTPGSVGRAMPYNEVRILPPDRRSPEGTPGEILVRGANVIGEYFEDSRATREAISDGWLHTGDLGFFDAKANLVIAGRKKDMVIRRGLNVYPREVARILSRNPEIQNVQVSGHITHLPDHRFAESLTAEIFVKTDSALTAESVLEWARENLSAYKIPEEITIRRA